MLTPTLGRRSGNAHLVLFGIVVSLSIGIILALGILVVNMSSVIFIESIRGVPWIIVLFMASGMLPMLLSTGAASINFCVR